MNSKSTIIGLVAAIAVLSGAMGLSVTGAFSDQTIAQYAPSATGLFMGQVIIEAHNADGELIAYRVGDNAVVDDGEQCILKMLFGSPSNTDNTGGRGEYTSSSGDPDEDACTGILTGAWDVIAIGLGTTTPADTDVKLQSEVTDTGLKRMPASTKTWQNGTGSGGGDGSTQIVLKHTFTSTGVKTITESGLFNMTGVAGSGMLAHKTFTAVSLASDDSITVTWTFKVGD